MNSDRKMRKKLDELIAFLKLPIVKSLGSEKNDYQDSMCFERYIHTFDPETNNQYSICGEKYTYLSKLLLQPNINETLMQFFYGNIMGNSCLKSWLRITDPCPYCGSQIFSSLVNIKANNLENNKNNNDE